MLTLNTVAKILKEILANRAQKLIKTNTHHELDRFFPYMQGQFKIYKSTTVILHIKWIKDKNHMAITTGSEKDFDKSPTFLYDKSQEETWNRRNIFQHNGNCIK